MFLFKALVLYLSFDVLSGIFSKRMGGPPLPWKWGFCRKSEKFCRNCFQPVLWGLEKILSVFSSRHTQNRLNNKILPWQNSAIPHFGGWFGRNAHTFTPKSETFLSGRTGYIYPVKCLSILAKPIKMHYDQFILGKDCRIILFNFLMFTKILFFPQLLSFNETS